MDSFLNHILDLPPILAAGGPPAGDVAGTWSGLLFYIGIALGLSFFCSILEAVLLSTSPSYVEQYLDKGSRAGRLMHKHKSNLERPISAILTLNTIAHTVGAAGAGAEAVGIFGSEFFGLISAVLTFLILVFSEIIPKTVGATYWRQLMPFAAYSIQFLVISLLPAVWFLEKTTQVLRRTDHEPTITRGDIEAMARISASEGTLQERENRILRNLLHLANIQVETIMTPRTVVFACQQDMTAREVVEAHPILAYSRIPVFNDNMDDITGFVLRHDVYQIVANDEGEKPLRDFQRSIIVVPETTDVATALNEFITRQEHIALVIDEYGGTAGVLTMEDAIETLLGIEITDESDLVTDLRKMAEVRYERQRKLFTQTAKSLVPERPDFSAPSNVPSPGD